MDPLDRAAEATMTMTDAARVQAMRHTRRLTQAELARLASHLVGTEMPVPVALRALDPARRRNALRAWLLATAARDGYASAPPA